MGGILATLASVVMPMLGKLAIPKDVIVEAVDSFFDVIENHVEATEGQADDLIVGNAVKGLRALCRIPDGDD